MLSKSIQHIPWCISSTKVVIFSLLCLFIIMSLIHSIPYNDYFNTSRDSDHSRLKPNNKSHLDQVYNITNKSNFSPSIQINKSTSLIGRKLYNNKKKKKTNLNVHNNLYDINYKIHIIFSTECSEYQDWQSIVLFHSAILVKQPGPVTRIARYVNILVVYYLYYIIVYC